MGSVYPSPNNDSIINNEDVGVSTVKSTSLCCVNSPITCTCLIAYTKYIHDNIGRLIFLWWNLATVVSQCT